MRDMLGRLALPLGGLVAFLLMVSLASTAPVRPGVAPIVVVVFGALLPTWLALRVADSPGWPVGLLLGCLAMGFCTVPTMPLAILDLRGEPVAATVLSFDGYSGRNGPGLYTLEDARGERIPGYLTSDNELRLGTPVDVIADPHGWAHPSLSDESVDGSAIAAPFFLAVPFGFNVLACVMAVRARPSRPSHRRRLPFGRPPLPPTEANRSGRWDRPWRWHKDSPRRSRWRRG